MIASRRLDDNTWGTKQYLAAEGVGHQITTASRTRRHYSFVTGIAASADRHLDKTTLAQMRERCRMYDRETSLFSGMINRGIDNIVGSNFDFVPSTGDKELDKIAKRFITPRMGKAFCDAAGTKHFQDMLKTTLRAVWNDGDILWVKGPNGKTTVFEADQIESPQDRYKLGKRIVLGVELGDYNQPLAYYVKKRQSSGDCGMLKTQGAPLNRIDASLAFCPGYRTRFNQTRGVPFVAAILSTFDRMNNYLDYEQLAAESNAMSGFKITKNDTYDYETEGEVTNDDDSSSFDKAQKFEPGFVFEGAPGEDIAMLSSTRPGVTFEPYLITCCRIVGVGIGLPLELVMLDFSRTNYSSARASLGEARRGFRMWQRFLDLEICSPWYRWQIARGIASGRLPSRTELFNVRCQWPAWEYIDPVKEAQGNVIAISSATKSISDCIRERGGEPMEVFEELANDLNKLKDIGIVLPNTTLNITTNYNQE